MIGIESITASKTLASNITLLSNDVSALIDNTLPYLWLPLQVCRQFEIAFGLSWDPSMEIYLVNDSIHQQLQNLNPSVTFTFGNNNSSVNNQSTITLPYAAFDLQASKPIYPNGTNYFPLRRASSASQYTLGRAFLQEAYLFVDFEQRYFSLSQALFPADSAAAAAPTIVSIDHSSPVPAPGSPTNTSTPAPSPAALHATHPLSSGAIAGSALGASAFVVLVALLAFLLRRRRRRQRHHRAHPLSASPSLPPPGEKPSWPSSPEDDGGSPARLFPLPAAVDTRSVRELEDTQLVEGRGGGWGGRGRGVEGRGWGAGGQGEGRGWGAGGQGEGRGRGWGDGQDSRHQLVGSPAAKELPPFPREYPKEYSKEERRRRVGELGC